MHVKIYVDGLVFNASANAKCEMDVEEFAKVLRESVSQLSSMSIELEGGSQLVLTEKVLERCVFECCP